MCTEWAARDALGGRAQHWGDRRRTPYTYAVPAAWPPVVWVIGDGRGDGSCGKLCDGLGGLEAPP